MQLVNLHTCRLCICWSEIRCSSNTLFLIALADASLQCLFNWWWWWLVQNITFYVSISKQALLQERKWSEEDSTKMSGSHLSFLLPHPIVQLTWLSKWRRMEEYLHSFYNSRMRNMVVEYSLMYLCFGLYCLTLHINYRQGKTEGLEVYKINVYK